MNRSGYDWFRFWVHFACGALLGAVMGLQFWIWNWETGIPYWFFGGGFSLTLGLLGGMYGDRFWEWFLRNLRWW